MKKIDKMIDWMTNVFGPKLSKFSQNPWISAIQEAFQIIMPFILLGSAMSLINVLKGFEILSWLPYSSLISDYSFGLTGLFIVYLFPFLLLKKKGFEAQSSIGGLTALATYLIVCMPTLTEEWHVKFAGSFSASGLLVSFVIGIVTSVVFLPFLKNKLIKEDGLIPLFVANWFNTLIPVAIVIILGTVTVEVFHIDLFNVLNELLAPLLNIGQSFIGFILSYFIMIFLFAFGVNAWAVGPVLMPIWAMGIQGNIDAVAAGNVAMNINTTEVVFSCFLAIGGLGCTLPLVFFALRSKSQRIKQIGKAIVIPALFNINEPTVYGLPIAWNPILMIPFLLNGLILPAIVYIIFSLGLCNIPASVYQVDFPTGLSAYFATNDIRAIFWWVVVFVAASLIYYPFFKMYEKIELEKENAE